MTRLWAPDAGDVGHRVRMLTADRGGPPASARIVDVVGTPFDHVVRELTDLPAAVAGYIDLTTGSWAFASGLLNIGSDVLRIPNGQIVYLAGLGWNNLILGGGAATLEVQGSVLGDNIAIWNVGGITAVRLSHADAICYLVEGFLSAPGYSVEVLGGKRLHCNGGLWGDSFAALYIDGNIDTVQVSGVQDQATDYFVYYDSGTVRVAHFDNCTNDTSGATGIRWPAASMPSDGLLVVGCSFNVAAPFNGFTPASARVNVKACLNNAGLYTETAIVP
jgi:hypothetical protein